MMTPAGIASWFDASSLGAALTVAVLGTVFVLLQVRRRGLEFALPERLMALLRAVGSTHAPLARAGKEPEPAASVTTPPQPAAANDFVMSMLVGAQPACPLELSRRIDRIEARLKARSAKRNG